MQSLTNTTNNCIDYKPIAEMHFCQLNQLEASCNSRWQVLNDKFIQQLGQQIIILAAARTPQLRLAPVYQPQRNEKLVGPQTYEHWDLNPVPAKHKSLFYP